MDDLLKDLNLTTQVQQNASCASADTSPKVLEVVARKTFNRCISTFLSPAFLCYMRRQYSSMLLLLYTKTHTNHPSKAP